MGHGARHIWNSSDPCHEFFKIFLRPVVSPSETNLARFLIAGIGGAVVGLFNNLNITQGASIPPLALAFLVGYAVDVFFAFLEKSASELYEERFRTIPAADCRRQSIAEVECTPAVAAPSRGEYLHTDFTSISFSLFKAGRT